MYIMHVGECVQRGAASPAGVAGLMPLIIIAGAARRYYLSVARDSRYFISENCARWIRDALYGERAPLFPSHALARHAPRNMFAVIKLGCDIFISFTAVEYVHGVFLCCCAAGGSPSLALSAWLIRQLQPPAARNQINMNSLDERQWDFCVGEHKSSLKMSLHRSFCIIVIVNFTQWTAVFICIPKPKVMEKILNKHKTL